MTMWNRLRYTVCSTSKAASADAAQRRAILRPFPVSSDHAANGGLHVMGVVNIHRIMIVSGLLTMTMIYAALAPEAALRSTFGESVSGPVADIVVRNWRR